MGIQMFMKIVSILQAFFQPCQALDLSISEPDDIISLKKRRDPRVHKFLKNLFDI